MTRLGEYRPEETILHRLDPRVKLLSVVALSLLTFAATPFEILFISVFLAAVAGVARMGLSEAAEALRPVAFFIALIFLVHLLLTDGRPLLSFAPLPMRITREGLLQGSYVAWQFAGLVLAGAILTRSTSPSELVAGMERLLRPLSRIGIPAQDFAVMIAIALRFMPILLEEYDQLRAAQTARGADFATGNVSRRTRTVYRLAVPLLFSAFRRADELAIAMEARGYRRGPRAALRELSLSKRDLGACAVMGILLLAAAVLRTTGASSIP